MFLFLSFVIGSAGATDGYAAYGEVARPGSLPASNYVAVWTDSAFVFFLLPLALVLLITPSGALPSRGWRVVWWTAIISTFVALASGLVSPRPLENNLAGVANPLSLGHWGKWLEPVGLVALILLHLAVIASAASLVVRWRTADPTERLQLRWLALAAALLPVFIVAAWAAAASDRAVVLSLLAGAYVSLLPIAAAFAIEQYHLYEVERVLSRALSYVLLSAGLAAVYAVVVVTVGRSFGSSGLAIGVATLAAAVIARPALLRLQHIIDRRFNRREFDAVSTVHRHVKEPAKDIALTEVLSSALGGSHVDAGYWIEDRQVWVTAEGERIEPPPLAREVRRRGVPVAFVSTTSDIQPRLLSAVLAEAMPELENERLRAAITLQLAEVRQSRARIVAAQLAERERLERNLHDGAQQRLLSIAMDLQAAGNSGADAKLRPAIEAAVGDLQRAVRELRELANGLHPGVLSERGLSAALDELAGRVPVDVRFRADIGRLSSDVEAAAWFIACEAVTNAVKHATPATIWISATQDGSSLELSISDDGRGGADPSGGGLRGLADRADALGGQLVVSGRAGGGTIVRAVIPCE
ncbi:hypothetical protein AYO38_05925 [bacterium SCGC AG-212-C10]|nr:hypothetical protein AYO38_05925 [bacterium SCGC AG-212-C10]